jgi:predicted nucleic acid-binding protein
MDSFIDSNIIVYAYNKADHRKHAISVSLLRPIWKEQKTFATSLQTLGEFFSVITKKVEKPLDSKIAQIIVMDMMILSTWKIVSYNKKIVMMALNISSKFKMPYWDSLITATMTENHISTIYTENVKDFKVPWIKAINPFKD